MNRKAIVAGIGEKWVDLLTLDEVERAHEESCGTGASCGSSGCGCRVNGLPFRAAKPKNITVRPGDTVSVSTPRGRALGASLAVMGIPIIAGAAGWFLASGLFPDAAEAARAGLAAVALVAAAGIIVAVGGKKREDRLPEITDVVG